MAFTGHAVYDTGVMDEIAESVQTVITDISPRETPFLDATGDADLPARHVLHEWLEDDLAPNRLAAGAAVASSTADTAIAVSGGLGRFMQPNQVLSATTVTSGQGSAEHMRILSIQGPNTIVVERAFAGTSASSYDSADLFIVIGNATLDGQDVSVDSSRPRTRVNNWTQIFKQDVIVSGTSESMDYLGGITSEMSHQVRKKLIEAMRELERTVILGRTGVNTTGSGTAVRSMRGLMQFIDATAANVKTYTTTTGSAATAFEQNLLDAIEVAWQNGGTDIDLIMAGAKLKRQIDQLNAERIRTVNVDPRFGNTVYQFTCAYGELRIMLNRWMHGNQAVVVATDRVKVTPLQKRAFTYKPIATRGDWEGGMVIGEYTLEVRNPKGMAIAKFPNLGTVYTP